VGELDPLRRQRCGFCIRRERALRVVQLVLERLRFIEAQQAKAARVVRAHIATMSDAELARFGWTEHQIRALRTGNRTANGTQGEVS
jgi:hypothetical protein